MPGSLPFNNGESYVTTLIKDIYLVGPDQYEEKCSAFQFLINQRQNLVESKNNLQLTPIHHACSYLFENGKQMDFLRFLIKNKADVNAKGICGLRPLHLAVCSWHVHENSVNLIKELLTNGADPDKTNDVGFTMLHLAVRLLPPPVLHTVVELLVGFGKTNSFSTVDFVGGTPLHKAVSHLQPELLKDTLDILKKHGVDFNGINGDGRSILEMATESGYSSYFLDALRRLGAKE